VLEVLRSMLMTMPAPNRIATWLRGLTLLLGGAITLGFAVIDLRSTRELVEHAHHANGTVVALNAGTSHPEVRFKEAESGEQVSFPANGWVSHRVGEQVKVLYIRRDSVMTAKLDESGALWHFPVMTALTGAGLVLASLFVLCRRPRQSLEN